MPVNSWGIPIEMSWVFDQPPNCAVITSRGITEGCESILRVTHDTDDHGWQFLGSTTPTMEDACVVALKAMVEIDPSIQQLADLPVGWHAWRRTPSDGWTRERNPTDES